MGSPFFKAVNAAFGYFPYGFEGVQKFDDWLVGPTMLVRIPPDEIELVVMAGFGAIPPMDKTWQQKTTAIISAANQVMQEVSIEPDKHLAKCTGRAILNDSQDGRDFPMELAFPLYNLARKLKVDTFKQAGIVLYGWKEGKLVYVSAARYRVCDGSVTIQ